MANAIVPGTIDCEPGTLAGATYDVFAALIDPELLDANVQTVLRRVAYSVAAGWVNHTVAEITDAKYLQVSGGEIIGGDGGAGVEAPDNAEYLVGAVHADLTAERLVTNTTTIAWDLATPGQAKADVTSVDGVSGELADPQPPKAHASSHGPLGSDPLKLDDLDSPEDNTDLDATTLAHGLLPKLSGVGTEFLAGDGSWAVPSYGPAETLADTLAAGNIVNNGQSIVGEDGGSISFTALTGLINLTDASGTVLYLAGAESGDAGGTNSDDLVIGDGTGHFGITIFAGAAHFCNIAFTDTAGVNQGGLAYSTSGDQLFFRAGGSLRAYVSSAGFMPVATATYAMGSTGSRWYRAYFSDMVSVAGGPLGHNASADDLSVGDGTATARGMTFYSTTSGTIYFADTLAGTQGGFVYTHASDTLDVRAGAAVSATFSATALYPGADDARDLGLTATRWRDGYFSGEVYVSDGVTGHDANADDLSIGDGSATARGATFYSTTGSAIYFADTLAGSQGGFTYTHATDSLTFRAGNQGRAIINSNALYPSDDGGFDLGISGTNRFTNGYFSNSVSALYAEFAQSASTPGGAMTADAGRWWTNNNAPTEGMFTDDDGNEINVTRMPIIGVGVGDALLSTTNPATYAETGGGAPVLSFANGADQTAHWWIQIPRNYLGGSLNVRTWWTGTTASANNVEFELGFDKAVAARDLTIDNATYNAVNDSGPAAIDQLKSTVATLSNANMNSMAAGDLVRLILTRKGSTDAYTGAVGVLGLQIYP